MAEYKVVNAEKLDADLASVADAIRTKGGTSESLEFPQGFVDAVGAIESGGGGTEANVKGVIFSGFSGAYNNPTVADMRSLPTEWVPHYMFANASWNGNGGYFVDLQEVYLPQNCKLIGNSAFYNCWDLKTLYGDFSNLTAIDSLAFSGCGFSSFLYLPNLQTIGNRAFERCIELTDITLPNTITNIASTAFNGCTNLTKINCLFAEGSVTGQPWGATNAVVEYVTGV